MTLDRDIHANRLVGAAVVFESDQIVATQKAIRQRKAQLGRSIAAAEAAHRAGAKIQHGTHDRNVSELAALAAAYDNLEAARKAIGQHVVDQLNQAKGTT